MRKRAIYYFFLAVLIALPTFLNPVSARAGDEAKDEGRLQSSRQVVNGIITIIDGVPRNVLYKADCVIVLPYVLKDSTIVRESRDHGAMTCRSGDDFQGPWGAPVMMALEGDSIGQKPGAQSTGFVLLVMNPRSAMSMLTGKVGFGSDVSVAVGPVGRDANADPDVTLRAEVLTYSRSRVALARIWLAGSTLRPDNDANMRIYGKGASAKEIALHNEITVPRRARLLIDTLNHRIRKVGIASWYGGRNQGRKMADGQRFDRRQFTAASWDFPLGTFVRVVNVKNGDSVVVTITDRGPKQSLHRVIDLSEAAAKQLDYLGQGLTWVYLYPLPSFQFMPADPLNANPSGTNS